MGCRRLHRGAVFTLANEAHKKGLTANMHLTCTYMDESLIAKA